jgi:uncharacterized membrane protein
MIGFANPQPAYIVGAALAAAAGVAWLAYRRVALSPRRRNTLSILRFTTLVWLGVCLMRPMIRVSGTRMSDAIVPILVDASRSMSLVDVNGRARIETARSIVEHQLQPAISPRFATEVLRFGERVSPVSDFAFGATDGRTDLGAALAAVRERYQGRPVAGIVVVSDGGDNGASDPAAVATAGAPVFPLGIGAARQERDREVTSVTTAESVLSDALVDVSVSAVAHGYGTAPIELRLLEDGRAIDLKRAQPAADGVPVTATFEVTPRPDAPTVYSVQIPPAADELTTENNERSTLVPAARRPRRVLLVQGAPGFEQAFLKRAWSTDRGLEVDSALRKGKDDSGANTFYVQAPQDRANALLGGFPPTREALFGYDVVVLANVDADELTSTQLELTRAFVGERGGGLLMLGARGFHRQGLRGTALEDVLPLDLSQRDDGVLHASISPGANRVALTAAGEAHPMMQLATGPDDNARRWATIPPLASVTPLGSARPGANILAVTGGSGGSARALIAVESYGRGRAMVFTGEASWRWRMMLPSTDTTYDRFWRQAVRWLGQGTPDPVAIEPPTAAVPGESVPLIVDARDAAFAPQSDAIVNVRVTSPSGSVESARAEAITGQPGRYRAVMRVDRSGVYGASADAHVGTNPFGSASGAFFVGGVDREMADPRLNGDLLERVARASGGGLIDIDHLDQTLSRLSARAPAAALALHRDLWHTGWSLAVILALVAAEWLTRRKWGLR